MRLKQLNFNNYTQKSSSVVLPMLLSRSLNHITCGSLLHSLNTCAITRVSRQNSKFIKKSISSTATDLGREQSNSTPSLVRHKRRTLAVVPTELPTRFKMEWPKITLFGDSITRRSFDPNFGCWGSLVANKVGNFFDVDFRGFEGYNSRRGLELAPKLFPKSYLDKVEIFIPFFGHNDSFEPDAPIHVPVDQYEVNMRAIVQYLLDNGINKDKIILITPTWYDAKGFSEAIEFADFPPMCKKFENQEKYSDAIKRLAKEFGLEVVDFFTISAEHKPLGELFCDGIHLSREGAKLLYESVMPVIEKKIEKSFKKPLADLLFATPFDQLPEVEAFFKAYITAPKK